MSFIRTFFNRLGSFSFRVGNRGPESSGAGNPPLADWLLILYRINGLSFVSMVDLLLRAQSTYFILNDAIGKWHAGLVFEYPLLSGYRLASVWNGETEAAALGGCLRSKNHSGETCPV
jgi:hypothetical protein